MRAIRLNVVNQIDTMSEVDFMKARIDNNWAVFNLVDLNLFILDFNKAIESGDATDDMIEKAKKDISKLMPILITDSIGRTKTVCVKPMSSNHHDGFRITIIKLTWYHHKTMHTAKQPVRVLSIVTGKQIGRAHV